MLGVMLFEVAEHPASRIDQSEPITPKKKRNMPCACCQLKNKRASTSSKLHVVRIMGLGWASREQDCAGKLTRNLKLHSFKLRNYPRKGIYQT